MSVNKQQLFLSLYSLCLCGLIIILAMTISVNGQGIDEQWPVPEGARVSLSLDQSEFFLGENILLHFAVENVGDRPFQINVGGDYRGASRALRFKVTATDEAGNAVTDPDTSGFCMGGLSHSPEIKPAEIFYQSLPLARYCRFDRPGVYTVRASHDLGWQETPARKIPTAVITIKLLQPTEAQARKIVEQTFQLPENPDQSSGKKTPPYADFSTLSYPVYLPLLVEKAKHGSPQALTAIGNIATPEATQALIGLLEHKDPAFALKVAQTLNLRLPDPEFEGRLQPRSVFKNSSFDERRKRLINLSWRSEFALPIRLFARKLLARDDRDSLVTGAFIISCIGESVDLAELLPALDRAVVNTKTAPLEKDIYPLPRGACTELIRALDISIELGSAIPVEPKNAGEAVLFLRAIGLRTDFRPDGWENMYAKLLQYDIPYVRQLALENLPVPLTASQLEIVRTLLADADINVRIAACDVAKRAKAGELAEPILKILSSLDRNAIEPGSLEFWLINAADNAAYALGARLARLQIWASHLDEEGMARAAIEQLAGIVNKEGITSYGARDNIDIETARALKVKWTKFLQEHGKDIQAGRVFKIGEPELPADLFQNVFSFSRKDKPAWP